MRQVIDLYAALYGELLAVRVISGQQDNKNKVSATAVDVDEVNTAVVVAYIPTLGQCIQGDICRELGQSFSKQYGITVSTPLLAQRVARNHLYICGRTHGVSLSGLLLVS